MAFNNCPNCDAHITCSCQYQLAKDGTNCCDYCVANYNLAMDLATAIVETTTTEKPKKSTTKDESSPVPGGVPQPPDDQDPEVL